MRAITAASATTTAAAAVARSGQFSGPTFLFGAPLLSVHPIDNDFDVPETDDEGETQPVDENPNEKRDE